MLRTMAAILGAALSVLLLDILWLGLLMRDFVHQQLGPLLLEQPRLPAAALFYLLYGAGVTVFAVHPALAIGAWQHAARQGALLGLTCYMTYDLSNLATLKGWPVQFALVDILWGGFVTTVAALAGYAASRASILGAARLR